MGKINARFPTGNLNSKHVAKLFCIKMSSTWIVGPNFWAFQNLPSAKVGWANSGCTANFFRRPGNIIAFLWPKKFLYTWHLLYWSIYGQLDSLIYNSRRAHRATGSRTCGEPASCSLYNIVWGRNNEPWLLLGKIKKRERRWLKFPPVGLRRTSWLDRTGPVLNLVSRR